MSVTQTGIILPTNPADIKKIQDAIIEADNSMLRIDSEKEQIKAIIDNLHEQFPDIGKKHFSKLIRVYHKQNIDQVSAESDDLAALYETVVKA